MKKIVAFIMIVILSLTFIVVYNSEKVENLDGLIRFEKNLDHSYQLILPSELNNKNQIEVYEIIKDTLKEVNGNIYYDRLEGESRTKYVYVTDNKCFSDLSVEGRMISVDDMESNNYLSTQNINDSEQVGKLLSFSEGISFEIKSLKSMIEDGYMLDGYTYVSFNSNNNINEFSSKLEERLGIDKIEIQEELSGVSSESSLNIILIGALYLIVILTIIYGLIKSYKKIAIQKLMGISERDIWIKLMGGIVSNYLLSILFVIILFSIMLFKSYNILYFEFIYKIIFIYTMELLALIIIIAIPFQYIRKVKIVNMLKNKKPTKEIVAINFVVKVIFMVVFIIIINLCLNQYEKKEIAYINSFEQWDEIDQYYSIPYVVNQPDDIMMQSSYWENQKNIYTDFSNDGGILCDFTEYSPGVREIRESETTYEYERNRVKVNPNYLEKYPVYDIDNNRIKIDESEEGFVFLIPEKYKPDENEILEIIKFQRSDGNNVYDESKGIKFIWIKNSQKLFSMLVEVNPEEGNLVEDSIIEVVTNSNGNDFSYMCMLGISGNPYKIKVPESENPKEYIKSVLKKYGYSNYVSEVVKVNDGILGESSNIKDVLKSLAITVGTLGTIIIMIIFQGVYNFFEQSKQKIIIRQLSGYRWIDKYKEYLLLSAFSWFIIINSLIVSNLINIQYIIIISISCIIVELLATIVAFYIINNKKIAKVIKGAE